MNESIYFSTQLPPIDAENMQSLIGHPEQQGCLELSMTPEFQHGH